MPVDNELLIGGLIAVAALLALFWLVRRVTARNRSVANDPALWRDRDYRCPDCGVAMQQGWVLLGKGAIWSPLGRGKPGTFSHIGSSLENTISLSVPPALNMAWHCPSCRILLLDHDKLVRR